MAIKEPVVDVGQMITDQQNFYKEFLGLTLDFSSVPIPQHQPGRDRLLVNAQGFMPNRVYEACAQHFPCSRYTDNLDTALNWDMEERSSKDGSYTIWVRDRQEADEELQNLSANQIREMGLTTETLTERLLHGLKYWSETKKYLDTSNTTYCTGSRGRGGRVPCIDWGGGELVVYWYDPRRAGDGLRARAVVS